MEAADRILQTTVAAQQQEIIDLRAADRKIQGQFIQALTMMKSCQTELISALVRIRTLETARSAQPEAPKDAGSCS